jgi:hypothetical protein
VGRQDRCVIQPSGIEAGPGRRRSKVIGVSEDTFLRAKSRVLREAEAFGAVAH